ncbi:hypothetical protein VNO77_03086 [Canavalia gladiata]|uniref:Uncharacterized protein n=1 Tax=Canavalia gladiata TaxID=3824 RepID=A0AAN9MZA2_CANGL
MDEHGPDARRPRPFPLACAMAISWMSLGEVPCSASEIGDGFLWFLSSACLPLGTHIPPKVNSKGLYMGNTANVDFDVSLRGFRTNRGPS